MNTRVHGQAHSAAAFLASLGDTRRADTGSLLRYHNTAIRDIPEMNSGGAEIAARYLAHRDAEHAAALARRALASAGVPAGLGADDLEPSDWRVVATLVSAHPPAAAGSDPDVREDRITRLRATVQTLVDAQDAMGIEALYRRLFEHDVHIGAALACELRLLDGLGDDAPGWRAQDDETCLRIPEWHSAWPNGRVPTRYLCRHTLILGETGSGKTMSGIQPVLRALTAPDLPHGTVGCVLVVDPKQELWDIVDSRGARLLDIDGRGGADPRALGVPHPAEPGERARRARERRIRAVLADRRRAHGVAGARVVPVLRLRAVLRLPTAWGAIVDFTAAVDRDSGTEVLVIRPLIGSGRGLVAKAVKALFFEAVLCNARRASGGSMPVVGYVSDEFHRFVTADGVHREQSYLDTCRSFGGFCVLASQSMASMHHALGQLGTGQSGAEHPRDRHAARQHGHEDVFPHDGPGHGHAAGRHVPDAARTGQRRLRTPPSTLRPGECYLSLPDGRFERRQITVMPDREAQPVRDPSPQTAGLPRALEEMPKPGRSDSRGRHAGVTTARADGLRSGTGGVTS